MYIFSRHFNAKRIGAIESSTYLRFGSVSSLQGVKVTTTAHLGIMI